MPAYPSDINKAVLRECVMVVLVADTGPDASARIKSTVALLGRLGIEQHHLRLAIVERAGPAPEEELASIESSIGVPIAGVIPFDANSCIEAQEQGVPVFSSKPRSAMAWALRGLADEILALVWARL